MKFLILLLSVISIWIFAQSAMFFETFENGYYQFTTQESVKDSAFTVLREKCNVCHATKKRTDIFTIDNMDSLAVAIYKQVFVKKKMPKGRKIKLTGEEQQMLEKWLSTIIKDAESTQYFNEYKNRSN